MVVHVVVRIGVFMRQTHNVLAGLAIHHMQRILGAPSLYRHIILTLTHIHAAYSSYDIFLDSISALLTLLTMCGSWLGGCH